METLLCCRQSLRTAPAPLLLVQLAEINLNPDRAAMLDRLREQLGPLENPSADPAADPAGLAGGLVLAVSAGRISIRPALSSAFAASPAGYSQA